VCLAYKLRKIWAERMKRCALVVGETLLALEDERANYSRGVEEPTLQAMARECSLHHKVPLNMLALPASLPVG